MAIAVCVLPVLLSGALFCRSAAAGESLAPVGTAPTQVGAESWIVFASVDCEECHWLENEFLPAFRQQHSPLPPIFLIDIDRESGYEALVQVEQILQCSGSEFPVLITGTRAYYGQAAIAESLVWPLSDPGEQLLPTAVLTIVRGAVPAPFGSGPFPGAVAPETAPTEAPPAAAAAPAGTYAKADLLYFETTGCKSCARVEKQLRFIAPRFPGRVLHRVNALQERGRLLQMAVAAYLDLPAGDCLRTPMVVSGAAACYGEMLTDANLTALFREAPETAFWRDWDEAEAFGAAQRRLLGLAANFTWWAVIGFGLIDGINPCAFAVIIFLVSYLMLAGNLGRRHAFVYGVTFCAGVFLCYFLIGLGFFRVLDTINRWRGLARTVFMGAGVLCLLFAVGALIDVVNARRQGVGQMRFGMPKFLRNVVHRLIRENVRRSALAAGAFSLGIVVSALELVCTGQIYLPAIMFMNSASFGGKSLVLLGIYNLAFITPLLAVVALAAGGLGIKSLSHWATRHAVVMRAATGLVLLVLALTMFYFGRG